MQRGLTKGQTRKGKYDGKRARADAMAVWKTAKGELQMGKSVEDNRWKKNHLLDHSVRIT